MKKAQAPSRQPQNFHSRPKGTLKESGISEAASVLLYDSRKVLDDSKKVANELYEEGKNRIHEVQNNIKEYSDQIAHRVHEKPLLSLLIAGGVGFLLSMLLRR
ncbi:Bacterial protein of uncharacterised function (DUF883) [Legionella lansingensis]|uniref:DUF883 domain-containing protein n=1 Tax=Legionella lansingensis TaxID=45067 RepID=A0A0W0VQP3_9GAMM|nr:hypothetical protein [Legionella lansingensis]KTD22319.1 hypothetical protein Llan_1260 [Legionella lansingensis]SNV50744.1 Bacterial protein of uncharacterised function (DUF883) [Legionella lansingensis]